MHASAHGGAFTLISRRSDAWQWWHNRTLTLCALLRSSSVERNRPQRGLRALVPLASCPSCSRACSPPGIDGSRRSGHSRLGECDGDPLPGARVLPNPTRRPTLASRRSAQEPLPERGVRTSTCRTSGLQVVVPAHHRSRRVPQGRWTQRVRETRQPGRPRRSVVRRTLPLTRTV